jgi:raffinose/stachyose/melibiose transport system permease protein
MKTKEKSFNFAKPRLGVSHWTVASLWLAVATLPFIFMVFMGMKTSEEQISDPVWKFPADWQVGNFKDVITPQYLRSLLNSVIVVSISMAITVLIASMAAFAFALLRFRLNAIIFSLVVASLIVPIHTTLLPIYILTNKLHIYDTLAALIGPYVAFSIPISIFILTQFMREIPRDLAEASLIDGASIFRMFRSVYFPLAKNAIVTVGIFNAVSLWNEFVFAYVLTSSPNNRTLPLAVWDFQGQYSTDIPALLASLTLSAMPLMLTYFVFQEKLVSGVMAGAVKA